MTMIGGGIEEFRGLALVQLEFLGVRGWKFEFCAIDTAFTEHCLFSHDKFYALTGREPRLSKKTVMLGDARKRNLWEETIKLKWFRNEITIPIFATSSEAPKEPHMYPLIGIKLLADCELDIDYPNESVLLIKN